MSPYATEETSRYSAAPVELYEITHGATVYRYAWSDKDETYGGNTFTKLALERGEIEFNSEAATQNAEVHLPLQNAVTTLFIADTPVQAVKVKIYRFHRGDTSDVIQAFVGEIVALKDISGARATFTCAPSTSLQHARTPWPLCQRKCVYATYSPECGVNKASFKTTATLSAVSGLTLKATAFDTPPDQWFRSGWVELANGDRRTVMDHVGDTLTLESPFPGLAPGTSVDAYAGDDHDMATCNTKFSNLVNFLGFDEIPVRNPYRGSIE